VHSFQRHRQTPFSQIQVSARAKTRASTSIILRDNFGEISGTRIKKSTLPYVIVCLSEQVGMCLLHAVAQMPNDLNISSEEENFSMRPAILSSCERK